MDPVQSWLDAKEVRRMADSLMKPPPEVDPSAVDAGYGDDFEGFADAAIKADMDAAATSSQVIQPDGRPHAQPQFLNAAVPAKADAVSEGLSAPDETQRANVENALASARRVAEESGMIQQKSQQPLLDEYDSPFRVSSNQQQVETDLLAQQVPVTSPAAFQSQQIEQDDWADLDDVGSSQPDRESEQESVFPPESVPPPSPPPAVALRPRDEPLAARASNNEATGTARGPFLSRLQQFSFILRRDLNAQAMFLIDNEGQILLDEVENPKLIQVARTLANASYRASRQSAGAAAVGNLHVKIGANATLEVVPVESSYGLLILGAIFPAPLGAARVIRVAEILSETVEPIK